MIKQRKTQTWKAKTKTEKLKEENKKIDENQKEIKNEETKEQESPKKDEDHGKLSQLQTQRVQELDKKARIEEESSSSDEDEEPNSSSSDPKHKEKHPQVTEKKNELVIANEDDVVKKNITDAQDGNVNTTPNQQLYKLISAAVTSELSSISTVRALTNASLSLYDFDNETAVAAHVPFSPFVISSGIPQIFSFESIRADNLQPNLADVLITSMTIDNADFDVIKKSIELWSPGVLTSRIKLNHSVATTTILDPNATEEGAVQIRQLDPIARFNPQNKISLIENRLFSLLSLFIGLDNVIVSMPRKLVSLKMTRGGEMLDSMSQMPIYSEMAPHFYYIACTNIPPSYRLLIDKLWKECPLKIGDMDVTTYAGVKLTQMNKTVIDQYTARVLSINYEKLQSNQLASSELIKKIQACLIPGDNVIEIPGSVPNHITLMYDYTTSEQELFMFRMWTSPTERSGILNALRKQLALTNRLHTLRIEDVWHPPQNQTPDGMTYESAWMNLLAVGDGLSPYDMLIFETFADGITFNVQPKPVPTGLPAMIEILSIYVFITVYPRISQRIINVLGFRLTQLYQASLGTVFTTFRQKYGAIRSDWMRFKEQDQVRLLTPVESQTGMTYSIFYDKFDSKQRVLKQFEGFLNNMNELIRPPTEMIPLTAKASANFPYMFDEYSAYPSWPVVDPINYMNSETTKLGDRIQLMIGNMSEYLSSYTAGTDASLTIPRGFLTYFKNWTNSVSNIVLSCGSAFELTCGRLQKTLMNSPFFTGSTYDPTGINFWYVQKPVGIAPIVGATSKATILPSLIRVDNFNWNIGIRHVMTMVGEFNRNNIMPMQSTNLYEANRVTESSDIGPMDGVRLMELYYGSLEKTKHFGYAMQITRWLVEERNELNPIKSVAGALSKYMAMITWVPLIRKVFTAFDVSFDEYFKDTEGTNTFIKDGRYLDKVLVQMDPINCIPLQEQPPNSKFGKPFEYVTPYDVERFEILSRPVMSYDSRVLNIISGWYFGKMVVSTMGPTQSDLSNNWTDVADMGVPGTHFRYDSYNNGQVVVLDYVSQIDNVRKQWIFPICPTNGQKLLIKMDSITKVSSVYTSFLAKAIYYGFVVIYVDTFNVSVTINDGDSLTTDYSEATPALSEVEAVVQSSVGEIFQRNFKTTNYAANFTSTVNTIPGYIQWFATDATADKTIFVSTISNARENLTQSIVPTSRELGYGPAEDGSKFNDNTLKIKSDTINWNNRIYTVSDRVMVRPEYRLIPQLPCQAQFET